MLLYFYSDGRTNVINEFLSLGYASLKMSNITTKTGVTLTLCIPQLSHLHCVTFHRSSVTLHTLHFTDHTVTFSRTAFTLCMSRILQTASLLHYVTFHRPPVKVIYVLTVIKKCAISILRRHLWEYYWLSVILNMILLKYFFNCVSNP